MWVAVLSLFPEMFQALSDHGVTGRAIREEKVSLHFWNPRDFTNDAYQSVDDRPFGGGPGMVMKVEPLLGALNAAKEAASKAGKTPKVVYLSPQGQLLKQNAVNNFAQQDSLILIAGRYEGLDQRFIDNEVDEEWSIGDYVLSGGELPSMVLLDALIRQLPGVLGHEESAKFDSFSEGVEGLLDCPHYTRPEQALGQTVPEVLLSGHHENIKRWRLEQSVRKTQQVRPELLDSLLTEGGASSDLLGLIKQIKTESE